MLVFARYIMFSEVYWHHAVRSATAMLQRAFWLLHDQLDFRHLFTLTESAWISQACDPSRVTPPPAPCCRPFLARVGNSTSERSN